MDHEIFTTLAKWLESGVPCALATVVRTEGSAPRSAGARMLIREDGATIGSVGGGAIEQAVMECAGEVRQDGQPRLLSYQLKRDLGMACGGAADVFVEAVVPPRRLYIFGGGHIALALSPMAVKVGFSVTVVDEREAFANRGRFPEAARLIRSYAPERWSGLIFDQRTSCVVMTPSHRIDAEVLRELLGHDTAYLGMIGSVRKRRSVEKKLIEEGVDPGLLARLHTPMGLPIGAESPAEIAVSILAELVQVKRAANAALDAEPSQVCSQE